MFFNPERFEIRKEEVIKPEKKEQVIKEIKEELINIL